MRDSLQVDTNGNGRANMGDTIRYTVLITNTGPSDATGVTFDDTIDPNTTLVNGPNVGRPARDGNDAVTGNGRISLAQAAGPASRPPFTVNIGTLLAGRSVTITFDVQINTGLPNGVTRISNQGTVNGSNFPSIMTNDPDTAAPNDATVTNLELSPSGTLPDDPTPVPTEPSVQLTNRVYLPFIRR